MNKHIELIKKWLADNDSVSSQELTDNFITAGCITTAALCAEGGNARDAAYWVKRYEESTK
jgi:hypothetical protein